MEKEIREIILTKLILNEVLLKANTFLSYEQKAELIAKLVIEHYKRHEV